MNSWEVLGSKDRAQEAKSTPPKLRVMKWYCEKGASSEESLEVKQVVRKSKKLGRKCEVGQQY